MKILGFRPTCSHHHHLSSHMKLHYRKVILNKISQPSWSIWGIVNMLFFCLYYGKNTSIDYEESMQFFLVSNQGISFSTIFLSLNITILKKKTIPEKFYLASRFIRNTARKTFRIYPTLIVSSHCSSLRFSVSFLNILKVHAILVSI